MTVAVMGCVRSLPPEFPVVKPENAGNMVHGDAPFRILPGAVSSADVGEWRSRGHRSFVDFVNEESSHLVLTLANTLRLDKDSLPNLERMRSFLEKVRKPVVIFGLGAQSQTSSVQDQIVPKEAVDLLRKVSEMTPQVGVRGEFTAEILREKVGISNIFVTGCPSIFSRPEGIKSLKESLPVNFGKPAFNGTKYHLAEERALLREAVQRNDFLIEPVNKFNHSYYVSASSSDTEGAMPYFLRGRADAPGNSYSDSELRRYFRENYRLFRGLDDWIAFNRESVSYTYGTRFHVNMASLISGKPALWLTHDARTRELVDYLNLPSRTVGEFRSDELDEIDWMDEYTRFFAGFEAVRARFERYLLMQGLSSEMVAADKFELPS